MKYSSRFAVVISVVAGLLAAPATTGAQAKNYGNHDHPRPASWQLSRNALPIGLYGGVGLKLDNHRVFMIAADTMIPGQNNRTFIYDVRTKIVKETAPVPSAKPINPIIGAGVLKDGTVLVTGGDVTDVNTGAPNPASVLTYRYDPGNNRWSRTGDLPEAQEWFFTPSSLLRDGRLLLAGGRGAPELTTGSASHRAFVYYPDRTTVVDAVDPQTGAKTGHKAVMTGKWDYTRTADGKVSDLSNGHLFGNLVRLADGRVLVAGGHSFWALGEEGHGTVVGFDSQLSVLAADTQFFDPSTGDWSDGTPLPLVDGEDDVTLGSHGGRTNGVCLAPMPDNTVVIAGGATHTDGQEYFSSLLLRKSVLVMTPGRDPLASTYRLSPNRLPAGPAQIFGDGGRNQLPCWVMSGGRVMIGGGQTTAAEDLYDTYLFTPRTGALTRGPDLVHATAEWGPLAGYPTGYQSALISTKESGMRTSQLRFPGDVFVHFGGYDGVHLGVPADGPPPGSHDIEQFGSAHHPDD